MIFGVLNPEKGRKSLTYHSALNAIQLWVKYNDDILLFFFNISDKKNI